MRTADPDGTITFANDRWFEYCGITPERNAREWSELVLHPEDRKRCIAEWTRALREGTQYEIEVRNRRHDGEYRWFLTRAHRFAMPKAASPPVWVHLVHDRKQADERQQIRGGTLPSCQNLLTGSGPGRAHGR